MLTTIMCNNCRKGKGINYKFIITEWEEVCNECGEQRYSKNTFDFCSLQCSKIYIERLDMHKCDDYYICKGIQLYNLKSKKIKHVWVSCSVCHKMERVDYKESMKIEGLKNYLR